jgi:hypothetical protein
MVNCQQKFARYFVVNLEFVIVRVFQNFYLFYSIISRGTLAGKHWSSLDQTRQTRCKLRRQVRLVKIRGVIKKFRD